MICCKNSRIYGDWELGGGTGGKGGYEILTFFFNRSLENKKCINLDFGYAIQRAPTPKV